MAYLQNLGHDPDEAAAMWELADSDPETRSPVRRLEQRAYRADLLADLAASRRAAADGRRQADVDATRCTHGVRGGSDVVTSDGSHRCSRCDTDTGFGLPAPSRRRRRNDDIDWDAAAVRAAALTAAAAGGDVVVEPERRQLAAGRGVASA